MMENIDDAVFLSENVCSLILLMNTHFRRLSMLKEQNPRGNIKTHWIET